MCAPPAPFLWHKKSRCTLQRPTNSRNEAVSDNKTSEHSLFFVTSKKISTIKPRNARSLQRVITLQKCNFQCNDSRKKQATAAAKSPRPAELPTFPSLMKKRRFILLLTCLGLTLASHAQQRRVQNKPFIDERRFHYGFFVGGHDLSLDLQNNGFISPETGEQCCLHRPNQLRILCRRARRMETHESRGTPTHPLPLLWLKTH